MLNIDEILVTIKRLDNWIIQHNYCGYDPFDGLGSPYAGWLTRRGKYYNLLRTVCQQVVLRSKFNLRPLFGIRMEENYKAMAYFTIGYLSLYRQNGDEIYRSHAKDCLDWLEHNANRNYAGLCWSNPHDYQSRLFYLPKGIPTVVGSFHAARAFMDAYETLGETEYLKVARSTCEFILRDLPKQVEGETLCISYIPVANVAVHNANMLAASLLMRVYKHTLEQELFDVALLAVKYTVANQHPDGSWYYGEAPNLHWVDNFHTGYVLDALKTCLGCGLNDTLINSAIRSGLCFFTNAFFGPQGQPYLWADRFSLIDIQGAAQCIETLVNQSNLDIQLLSLANRVVGWTIRNMQAPDGHFYFRRSHWGVNKVAHIHWGQATMLVALARLLEISATKQSRSSSF